MPPMMEAALRLRPGIMARHCQMPIINDFYNETAFSESQWIFKKLVNKNQNNIHRATMQTATDR